MYVAMGNFDCVWFECGILQTPKSLEYIVICWCWLEIWSIHFKFVWFFRFFSGHFGVDSVVVEKCDAGSL